MTRRRRTDQVHGDVVEKTADESHAADGISYDLQIAREIRRKDMSIPFHFERDEDQIFDLKIGSVFVYGITKGVYSSKFDYRFALFPIEYDKLFDKDDGFDANVYIPDALSALLERILFDEIVEYHGAKKTLELFNKQEFCVKLVKSSLLSFFELLHHEYEIEYPLARKLALEFHNRAEAVAVSKSTLFRDRTDKSQSASDFLIQHYGERLQNGDMYQNELRKLDPTLMKGLDNEFGGRRDELAKLIPTRRAEVNMRLGPDAELMSVDERRKALTRMLHLGKK